MRFLFIFAVVLGIMTSVSAEERDYPTTTVTKPKIKVKVLGNSKEDQQYLENLAKSNDEFLERVSNTPILEMSDEDRKAFFFMTQGGRDSRDSRAVKLKEELANEKARLLSIPVDQRSVADVKKMKNIADMELKEFERGGLPDFDNDFRKAVLDSYYSLQDRAAAAKKAEEEAAVATNKPEEEAAAVVEDKQSDDVEEVPVVTNKSIPKVKQAAETPKKDVPGIMEVDKGGTSTKAAAPQADSKKGASGGLFGGLISAGSEIFEGMRDIIYAVAGFGIIAVAIGGFFGNLNWKWLSAIIIGLMVISLTHGILRYMVGTDADAAIMVQDTLITGN